MKKIYKKIKITLLLITISITTLAIFKVDASISNLPLLGKIIYLDAGHGGKDSGTTNKNTKEKDINLQITYKLKENLEKEGATIYLTRKNDNDLSTTKKHRKKSDFDNRIKLINNSQADIYISIHQNHYENNKYSGPQVFYAKEASKSLALIIQETLNKATNTKRTTKYITNTYMYPKINKKGILIECGFLSNEEENNKLTTPEYQEYLSKIITEGIINYFS